MMSTEQVVRRGYALLLTPQHYDSPEVEIPSVTFGSERHIRRKGTDARKGICSSEKRFFRRQSGKLRVSLFLCF